MSFKPVFPELFNITDSFFIGHTTVLKTFYLISIRLLENDENKWNIWCRGQFFNIIFSTVITKKLITDKTKAF